MAASRFRWLVPLVLGLVAGALIWAGASWINNRHHYRVTKVFFNQKLGGHQRIIGTAFIDYRGYRVIELNWWKVELERQDGARTTLYQRQAVLREAVPHQPFVRLNGREVVIDDGEMPLTVTLPPAS